MSPDEILTAHEKRLRTIPIELDGDCGGEVVVLDCSCGWTSGAVNLLQPDAPHLEHLIQVAQEQAREEALSARFIVTADLAGRSSGAAGLLRPDPTGEDLKTLVDLIGVASLDGINGISRRAAESILAAGFSRPRGPETGPTAGVTMARSNPVDSVLDDMGEWGDAMFLAFDRAQRAGVAPAPSVTDEQVEEGARALWRLETGSGEDEWKRDADAYRYQAREVLEAALGVEVRAGDPS